MLFARWSGSSFAADLFFAKLHKPWNVGSCPTKRPFGPFGIGCVQQFSATFGLSRLATAPGARRVHDARSLAGNEPAVVAGIIPGVNLRRIHRHEPLEVFQRFARLVRVDLDVVLRIDHDHTVGVEQRADPVDRSRRSAPSASQPDSRP